MAIEKDIKEKILKEFDSLPASDQQTLLGIVENYIHNKTDETEWNQLPENWKKRIAESLQQADTGQLLLHDDPITYLRKKYRLAKPGNS